MSEILEKYQLTYINRVQGNRNIKDCSAPPGSSTNISLFLYIIGDALLCEDIISEIDYALARTEYEGGYSLDGTSLEINSSTSIIDGVVEIPTKDLKAIISEWRKFLETPPLNHKEIT